MSLARRSLVAIPETPWVCGTHSSSRTTGKVRRSYRDSITEVGAGGGTVAVAATVGKAVDAPNCCAPISSPPSLNSPSISFGHQCRDQASPIDNLVVHKGLYLLHDDFGQLWEFVELVLALANLVVHADGRSDAEADFS